MVIIVAMIPEAIATTPGDISELHNRYTTMLNAIAIRPVFIIDLNGSREVWWFLCTSYFIV
jgi:hypothetical protein